MNGKQVEIRSIKNGELAVASHRLWKEKTEANRQTAFSRNSPRWISQKAIDKSSRLPMELNKNHRWWSTTDTQQHPSCVVIDVAVVCHGLWTAHHKKPHQKKLRHLRDNNFSGSPPGAAEGALVLNNDLDNGMIVTAEPVYNTAQEWHYRCSLTVISKIVLTVCLCWISTVDCLHYQDREKCLCLQ